MSQSASMWGLSLARILPYILLSCVAPANAVNALPGSAAQSKAKERVNIYQQYDRSKDVTRLQTADMLIYGSPPRERVPGMENSGLSMKAYYTYPGKAAASPPSVNIEFTSNVAEHRFNHTLTITADSEPFSPWEMSYKQKPGGLLTLTASIDPDVYRRITKALKVKMKIGAEEFTLTAQQLANLNALAMTITR